MMLNIFKPEIFVAGYYDRTVEDIEYTIKKRNINYLIDIRFKPFGQVMGSDLQKVLGSKYLHLQELGNVNYKNGRNIEIYKLDNGIKKIKELKPPMILMCGCKSFNTCHRREVGFALMEHGYKIKEINFERIPLNLNDLGKLSNAT